MALDVDNFKEEEESSAKLQKRIRELSEQLYRNVSPRTDGRSISSVVVVVAVVIFSVAQSVYIFLCVCLLDIQLCNPLNDAHGSLACFL